MARTTVKPIRLGRRAALPAHLLKQRRAHARQTGAIAIAWNELQSACFRVFESLLDSNNAYVALGIWHSVQSDNMQREMMLAVGKAVLPAQYRALAHLIWLKNKSGEMARFRNDPIHTPMAISLREKI